MDHSNGNGAAHAPAAPGDGGQTASAEDIMEAIGAAQAADRANGAPWATAPDIDDGRTETIEARQDRLDADLQEERTQTAAIRTYLHAQWPKLIADSKALATQVAVLAGQVERLEEEAGELKAQLAALDQKFEERLPPPRPVLPDGRYRPGRRKLRGMDGEILGSTTARKLRDAMKRARVTATELAAQFGVKPRSVQRWMKGESEPAEGRLAEWIQSVNDASTDQLIRIRLKAQEELKTTRVAAQPCPDGDK